MDLSPRRGEGMHRPFINPRFVPNVTQIPNVIFDYWMRHLSGAEFKVLLALCRKTFGWGQESEYVSNSQFVLQTGLTDTGVSKALKTLQEKGLVIKLQQGGGRTANFWAIQLEVTVRTYPSGRRYVINSSTIPNVLLDEIMAKVSPAEFKVLMLIARKTYGFHKEIDAIARSQFEQLTGLSEPGIKKCLKSLLAQNFIVRCREGGGRQIAQWSINTAYFPDPNKVSPQKSLAPKNEHLTENLPSNSVSPSSLQKNPHREKEYPPGANQVSSQNLYKQNLPKINLNKTLNIPKEILPYLAYLEYRYYDRGIYYFTWRGSSVMCKKDLVKKFLEHGIKVVIF